MGWTAMRGGETHGDGRHGPDAPEILRRLMPRRHELGITRIGDITGLDRLGIPVMQAVRPLSLSNSVAQGKGFSAEAAAVSALLESAECFFAERLAHFASVSASAMSLAVEPSRFALHLAEDCPPAWASADLDWTQATDLLSNEDRMIPLALIHTAYVHPPPSQDAWFQASTSGLAVAFNRHDAVMHGLLECIERDALARANRTHGFFQRFRIDPATIKDRRLTHLIDRMRSAGLLVGLWQAQGPLDVPVIWCHLLEEEVGPGTLIPFPAEGSAAGLDPARTACRAIEEAAQSRLAAISGAREDITQLTYPKYPDWALIDAHRRLLKAGPRPLDFAALPKADDDEDWLNTLVRRAADAGLSSILVTDLDTAPFAELCAVKVFVPELAPLLEG